MNGGTFALNPVAFAFKKKTRQYEPASSLVSDQCVYCCSLSFALRNLGSSYFFDQVHVVVFCLQGPKESIFKPLSFRKSSVYIRSGSQSSLPNAYYIPMYAITTLKSHCSEPKDYICICIPDLALM